MVLLRQLVPDQAANRTFQLIVLAYQHAALLTRAVETGAARRPNEPTPSAGLQIMDDQNPR
jgi:hypothetical protein